MDLSSFSRGAMGLFALPRLMLSLPSLLNLLYNPSLIVLQFYFSEMLSNKIRSPLQSSFNYTETKSLTGERKMDTFQFLLIERIF